MEKSLRRSERIAAALSPGSTPTKRPSRAVDKKKKTPQPQSPPKPEIPAGSDDLDDEKPPVHCEREVADLKGIQESILSDSDESQTNSVEAPKTVYQCESDHVRENDGIGHTSALPLKSSFLGLPSYAWIALLAAIVSAIAFPCLCDQPSLSLSARHEGTPAPERLQPQAQINRLVERYENRFGVDAGRSLLKQLLKKAAEGHGTSVAFLGSDEQRRDFVLEALSIVSNVPTTRIDVGATGFDDVLAEAIVALDNNPRAIFLIEGAQSNPDALHLFHACWNEDSNHIEGRSCGRAQFVVQFENLVKVQESPVWDEIVKSCQDDALACSQVLKEKVLPDVVHVTASENEDANASMRRLRYVFPGFSTTPATTTDSETPPTTTDSETLPTTKTDSETPPMTTT